VVGLPDNRPARIITLQRSQPVVLLLIVGLINEKCIIPQQRFLGWATERPQSIGEISRDNNRSFVPYYVLGL
jgi:hypothetical protein